MDQGLSVGLLSKEKAKVMKPVFRWVGFLRLVY